jgi:hypothetical protein
VAQSKVPALDSAARRSAGDARRSPVWRRGHALPAIICCAFTAGQAARVPAGEANATANATAGTRSSRREPRLADQPTLRDQILAILIPAGGSWLTATEIADQLNLRKQHRKRDGSDVTGFPVRTGAHNYEQLFEQKDGRIRGRAGITTRPAGACRGRMPPAPD